jgi:hypothetical protein
MAADCDLASLEDRGTALDEGLEAFQHVLAVEDPLSDLRDVVDCGAFAGLDVCQRGLLGDLDPEWRVLGDRLRCRPPPARKPILWAREASNSSQRNRWYIASPQPARDARRQAGRCRAWLPSGRTGCRRRRPRYRRQHHLDADGEDDACTAVTIGFRHRPFSANASTLPGVGSTLSAFGPKNFGISSPAVMVPPSVQTTPTQ